MPKKKRSDSQRTPGGAWGFKIMQSDHDYDIIKDVTGDLELFRLEGDDQRKAVANGDPRGKHKHSFRGDAGSIEEDAEKCVSYLIYAKLCSDIPKVRAHLNRGGLLRDLLHDLWRDYKANIKENERDIVPSKGNTTYSYNKLGYKFVLVAACGMSLGCQLRDFKQKMREVYKDVGLMRDALKQIEAATHPDSGYRDGIPWMFGSKGLKDTIISGEVTPLEDRLCEDSVNVRPPGVNHRMDKTMVGDMVQDMIATRDPASNDHGGTWGTATEGGDGLRATLFHNWGDDDKCGACGATDAKTAGQELLACSRCQRQKYCSPQCQRHHWSVHKHKCRTINQQIAEQGFKDGEPEFHPVEGEDELMAGRRKMREFLSKVDPELVRHYVNERLHKMVTEDLKKDRLARLPADWEETLRGWYHREPSFEYSPSDREKAVYRIVFGADDHSEDLLLLGMLAMHSILQGQWEGKDAFGMDQSKYSKLPEPQKPDNSFNEWMAELDVKDIVEGGGPGDDDVVPSLVPLSKFKDKKKKKTNNKNKNMSRKEKKKLAKGGDSSRTEGGESEVA